MVSLEIQMCFGGNYHFMSRRLRQTPFAFIGILKHRMGHMWMSLSQSRSLSSNKLLPYQIFWSLNTRNITGPFWVSRICLENSWEDFCVCHYVAVNSDTKKCQHDVLVSRGKVKNWVKLVFSENARWECQISDLCDFSS